MSQWFNGIGGYQNSLNTNGFFYVPQNKKSHTGLKRHEVESMMTEFLFLGDLSL